MNKLLPKTHLLNPIYYMEVEGYDCRIAVSKYQDFIKTLGDANLSLTYSNSKEYKDNENKEKLLVRRIHIRHAILDLNNCYDLLLQIPWFYYRVWQYYNIDGKLRINKTYQNDEDIVRNKVGWVQKAEESCTPKKLLRYFKKEVRNSRIVNALNLFYNSQIKYEENSFSVRYLANQIKHNHSIKFKELYQKPSLNLKINKQGIDYNELPAIIFEMCNIENPEVIIGEQVLTYTDDFYLDIHYKEGDSFFAKDYINKNRIYSMDEVYDKLIDYHTALLDLYEIIISDIKNTLQQNPFVNEPNIISTKAINMDKYFKAND